MAGCLCMRDTVTAFTLDDPACPDHSPALPQLTAYQRGVLRRLAEASGLTREGGEPWTRSWVQPSSPAESRAMARLHELQLVECQYGRASSKLANRYRVGGPLTAEQQQEAAAYRSPSSTMSAGRRPAR